MIPCILKAETVLRHSLVEHSNEFFNFERGLEAVPGKLWTWKPNLSAFQNILCQMRQKFFFENFENFSKSRKICRFKESWRRNRLSLKLQIRTTDSPRVTYEESRSDRVKVAVEGRGGLAKFLEKK